jgi:urease accessory protein
MHALAESKNKNTSTQTVISVRLASKTARRDKTMSRPGIILGILFATFSTLSFAHSGEGNASGFISGFMHPILGWDHVIAMVAVGLWGAFLGQPAIWLLPVVFPMVMAFGGALGVMGIPVPGVEVGIALSAVVLGILITFKARPPLWVSALIVACFAIFHGHAHGTELPEATNPLSYSLGFVIATGLLHVAGIAFGLLVRWPAGVITVQTGGAVIAGLGVFFLSQA